MGAEQLYTLPDQKATNPAQVAMQTIVVLLLISLMAVWAATEFAAWKLAFQPALGTPLIRLGSFSLYEPLDFMLWLFQFSHVEGTESAFTGGEWIISSLHLLFIPALWLSVRRAKKFSKKTDLHGSAHFANKKEVEATELLREGSDGHDVYLGVYKDEKTGKKKYLKDSGGSHIGVVAPTGSGKGVGVVLPTLLSWRGSILAYDMKKELWALTAGFRKAIGQKVARFEPTCTDGTSIRINPLNEVRIRTMKEVSDAQNIAEMIVDPDGKGMEDHWSKTGHELLAAAILHILYVGRNKTLRGLVSFFCDPRRSIEQVAESMLNTQHDTDNSQGWRDPLTGAPTLTHPVVAEAARSFLNKADNERSGVQSTALSFLSLYRDPIVAANTAVSDVMIRDLMNDESPLSLYLVVPASDRKRLRPLIRLIFNLAFRNLTEKMEYAKGKQVRHYKHRLLMVMDELPTLGKLEILEESIAFVRSYGIKILIIFQDYAQLHKAYTKDESVTSNTQIRVAYTPIKIETAELISKYVGKTTVQDETRSFSGNRLNPLPMHQMTNVNKQGRELLTADEVLRLPAPVKSQDGLKIVKPGAVLIFVMGHAPIWAEQILYFEDPIFRKRAEIDPPLDSDRLIDNPREILIETDPVDTVVVAPIHTDDEDEGETIVRRGREADGRGYAITSDGEVIYDAPASRLAGHVPAPQIEYTAEQRAAIEAEEMGEAIAQAGHSSESGEASPHA